MPPRNSRDRAKSLTGARGARGGRGARRNHDEEDDGNHQESVMGVGQVLLEEMWETEESRATTAMKAFLQLRPPTFKGEPEPLVAEDWREQVTRVLDTILVTEEDLRVLFASYQLQGDALQWWKTMEKVREGTSNQSEGRSSKKPRNLAAQQQYPARSSPATSVVSSGQTSRGGPICFGCHQPGHRIVGLPTEGSAAAVATGGTISRPGTGTTTSQGATYLLSVWSGGSYQSTVHAEGKQSGSYGIAKPTRSAGSEDARTGLCHHISSGTVGIAGQQEQQLDTSVVRGTLLMFNSWARVLIDTGASHSFIASSFASALGLEIEVLDSALMLDTPVGGRSTLKRACRSCEVEIADRRFMKSLGIMASISIHEWKMLQDIGEYDYFSAR
ncbi:hypothetical protein Acr_00g0034850 [Actinidia rufa]|uniref:Retrotransposon gag domain-containing protein n=1 Tax=Actinidia rufa TaxID=165716 RepID=A0A7J0DI14_9ERIC|nr:hypothetical protein Acr_00g0034850 [Actinidia rufa]